MRLSALVLFWVLLGAGCASASEADLVAELPTSEVPAATPTPAPTSTPAPTPTPTGPRTCVLEVPSHGGDLPHTNHVTEVSFEVPTDRYDALCSWSDVDVDIAPGTISVQFDETSLGGWFSHLIWGDLRDAVVTDAEFVQIGDRAAWIVELDRPADTSAADVADNPAGIRVQRHFVLDLGWQTMRLVAELGVDESAAYEPILAEMDLIVASIDYVADPDAGVWNELPPQGQVCPAGAFWEFDTPTDWFSYSDCRYFDTSSETDHAMQCECFPPVTTYSTATPFEEVGDELLDATLEEWVTPNGLAVRVLNGTAPANEAVSERIVRTVVVELESERLVLTGYRHPDHSGPGHTFQTTADGQDEIVNSIRAVRPLEPLIDVPVCASPDTPRPIIDPSDPYRPYARTGDYDGDGFLDTLTFVGDYGDDTDRPTATLWYRLGNGGELLVDAATTWPDYDRLGSSTLRKLAGLDGDVVTLIATDPGIFVMVQLKDCQMRTIGTWSRAAGHCYASTDDGDLLRLYGTAASVYGDLGDGHHAWDGDALTPIAPAPEAPLCGPDFGEGA